MKPKYRAQTRRHTSFEGIVCSKSIASHLKMSYDRDRYDSAAPSHAGYVELVSFRLAIHTQFFLHFSQSSHHLVSCLFSSPYPSSFFFFLIRSQIWYNGARCQPRIRCRGVHTPSSHGWRSSYGRRSNVRRAWCIIRCWSQCLWCWPIFFFSRISLRSTLFILWRRWW